MKALMRKSKSSLLLLTLGTSLATFSGAYAQNSNEVLNSDPINIDGYVAEPQATDHELESVKNELRKQKNAIQVNKSKSKSYKELSRTTEKLADVTEEYIEDKDDAKGTIDSYNKKIECLMEKKKSKDCDKYTRSGSDEVTLTAAAPAKVEATPNTGAFNEIKVAPVVGMTSFMGDNETLESDYAVGIQLEGNINSRFSAGLGVTYTSMTTTDFDYKANYNNYGWYNNYNNYYGNQGQGREIEYTNLAIDLYTKFFLTESSRFRPFVGAGLVYNRTNMEYSQSETNNYQYGGNNYNFGDESLSSNYMSGKLLGGAEVKFTDSIGMLAQLTYVRGLGDAFNQTNGVSPSNAPDQERLEELGEEIASSDQMSVFAGLLVTF